MAEAAKNKNFKVPRKEIRKSKDASIKEGALWSSMVGMGETYVSPFAIRLGATPWDMAILQSVPQMVGSISQLFSLTIAKRVRGRKKFTVAATVLQAIVWLGMAAIAFLEIPEAVPLVILLFSIYYALGMTSAPIWSSWISDIVRVARGAFFARRGQINVIFQLAATALAAVILGDSTAAALGIFAFLFIGAFAMRAASVHFMNRMHDKRIGEVQQGNFDWKIFFRSRWLKNHRRFSFFGFLTMFSSFIAIPFFDIYMLNEIGFSYLQWGILISAMAIAKIITLPGWGALADSWGNRSVLIASSIGILPIATLLWVFGDGFWYIFAIQMLTGAGWAGFDLAVFNYSISPKDEQVRTAQVAAFQFMKGSGALAGSMLGGWMLSALVPSIIGASPYYVVFALSALARVLGATWLAPRLRRPKRERGWEYKHMVFEIVAATPARWASRQMMGAMYAGAEAAKKVKPGKKGEDDRFDAEEYE